MKNIKKFENFNSDNIDEKKESHYLIARYGNGVPVGKNIRVEFIDSDMDDEDLQDIADEVEQQWGKAIILSKKEAILLMGKLQKLISSSPVQEGISKKENLTTGQQITYKGKKRRIIDFTDNGVVLSAGLNPGSEGESITVSFDDLYKKDK